MIMMTDDDENGVDDDDEGQIEWFNEFKFQLHYK